MGDKQPNELLHHYLQPLSPDVFCHPVWVHYEETDVQASKKLMQGLLRTSEELEAKGELVDACQILFICAALQLRSGDSNQALASLQSARKLAVHHNLDQAVRWADWGASSIYARQGRYQLAIEHLSHLQARLNEQNEWILADIITTIRGALQDYGSISVSAGSLPSVVASPQLNAALNWLLRWGESPRSIRTSHCRAASNSLSLSAVLAQSWQSLWHAAKRTIEGKLQPKWEMPTTHSPPATQSGQSTSASPALATRVNRNVSGVLSKFFPAIRSLPLSTQISRQTKAGPFLTVYCLGPFRVYQGDRPIEDWPGNKCKSVFKYIIAHRKQPIHHEILIDILWPDVDPEAGHRSLYQAIYNLRQALQNEDLNIDYVLCKDGCYYLNPELGLWVDSESFRAHYQTGQRLEHEGHLYEAIRAYEMADNLYEGEFLAEDRYEDWTIVHRENLKHAYLDLLARLSQYYYDQAQFAACIAFCQKILNEDNCREDAHRRLMYCYMRQHQRHLAMRQYHQCVEALKRELDVPPMPATIKLYDQIQENRFNF